MLSRRFVRRRKDRNRSSFPSKTITKPVRATSFRPLDSISFFFFSFLPKTNLQRLPLYRVTSIIIVVTSSTFATTVVARQLRNRLALLTPAILPCPCVSFHVYARGGDRESALIRRADRPSFESHANMASSLINYPLISLLRHLARPRLLLPPRPTQCRSSTPEAANRNVA